MPDRDKLYEKYRLFYEPHVDTKDGHPIEVLAQYYNGYDPEVGERWNNLQEAEGFFFVLRPEGDRHAVTALFAYAAACRQDFPKLSDDLFDILDGITEEEL